ncbi:MAG: FAD-dependent monooxygenase [Myxococcales bacterium]|nr:FAD-dependent monooxygenase [Myxococcales bacterium]
MPNAASDTDLLIVGAGPTGLAAACDALRHGLTVRIVERRATRSEYSKALVLHARTLEVLEVLGCANELVAAGQRFSALNVRTSTSARPLRVDLLKRSWGDTRYPFWLSIPQYEVERILEARLAALGGVIEWSTELTSLDDRGDHVVAKLSASSGAGLEHSARWVLGCDGGRSATREQLGVALTRQDVGVTFALADVHTTCELVEDEGHVVLSSEGVLLIVPMPERGLWRLIVQVPKEAELVSPSDWGALVQRRAGIELGIHRLGWTSKFDLTSGVADRFRKGNVFLLGDAAHVHSPVGGQGLNTGVQDAHNLVWKLALLKKGLATELSDALLDSYESERQPIARQMVRATSIATRLLTVTNPVVRWVRGRFARLVLSRARVQDQLARGVGMLDLETAGLRRLPNPILPAGDRLHDRIDSRVPTLLQWQGRDVMVRPDRILARPGSLPTQLAITARGS